MARQTAAALTRRLHESRGKLLNERSLWAKLTAKQRSNILRKWYELIVANRENLAPILTSEQDKPLSEALGELDIGGLCRVLRRRGAPQLWRNDSLAAPGCCCLRQATDWRLRRHTPQLDITREVGPALAAGAPWC